VKAITEQIWKANLFPRKIGKRFSVVVAAVSTAFPTNFAADDSGRYSL